MKLVKYIEQINNEPSIPEIQTSFPPSTGKETSTDNLTSKDTQEILRSVADIFAKNPEIASQNWDLVIDDHCVTTSVNASVAESISEESGDNSVLTQISNSFNEKRNNVS